MVTNQPTSQANDDIFCCLQLCRGDIAIAPAVVVVDVEEAIGYVDDDDVQDDKCTAVYRGGRGGNVGPVECVYLQGKMTLMTHTQS